MLSASSAQTLASFSTRVDGDVALLDELTRGAGQLGDQTSARLGRSPPTIEAVTPTGVPMLRRYWWVPVAAGAVFAAAAGEVWPPVEATPWSAFWATAMAAPLPGPAHSIVRGTAVCSSPQTHR